MCISYLDDYKDLKQLLAENPELPIMFMASEDCGNPDYGWTIASAKARIKHVLDEKLEFNDEKLYTDEDDLREDLEEYYYEEHDDMTQLQQEEAVNEKMEYYKDQWIKCIVVYVDAY